MLEEIVLVSPPGSPVADFHMPVLVPGTDGFCITKITGLGPVPTNVNTKGYGSGDGEYFIGRTRGKRNIVLTFAVETRGYNNEAVREDLYGHFYTQGDTTLKIRFVFDNKDPVEIDGFLETHEEDRFISDPEPQLSIICPKPNFIDPSVNSIAGETAINPAMSDLLTVGNRSIGLAVKVIPDAGTFNEMGRLIFESAVESDVPGVYLTDHKLEIFASDYDPEMIAGEELWMDSRLGRKAVYIYNPTTGEVRNALKGMPNESRWPVLHPGTSKFRVYTPAGASSHAWTAYWYDEYGGI